MAEQKKEIGRFFKHSYIYAIGNVINRIGAFLLLPVYTNYLTTTEYGALEMLYSVSAVISGFLSIGLAHATLRFYFEYGDDKNRNAVISTNYIAALILCLLGVALVGVWHRELSVLVFSSADYANGILIILGTLAFELSSQICLAYVRAIERSLFFVYIAIVQLLIQVSINIYLVIYANQGVLGILLGNFIAVFVGWLILTVFTLTRCKLAFHFHKLTVILKYSLPFVLGTVTSLVSSNVDKFGLNYMDALGAVGIYMLAMKFSMVIEQLIGEPFSRSYGSFRFSIMKNDNAAAIQGDIVKYLFYVTVFVALGISLFINDLLRMISAAEFWPASEIVPIIMIASIIKIINYPLQTGILYAKKTKYFFYFGVISAIISTIGNLSLIPIIGIYGACLTLIVTNLVSLLLMHRQSQKFFFVRYDLKRLMLCLLFASVIYLLSLPVGEHEFYIRVPLKIILVLSFMFAMLKSNWFLDLSEREKINQFWRIKIMRKTAKE